MKRINLLIAFLVFAVSGVMAQVHNPVKWSVGFKKLANNEAVILIKANVEEGWHIYGMNVPAGGPESTTFTYTPANGAKVQGKTLAKEPKSKFEDVFKMNVPYYNGEVVFQQKVKLANNKPTTVKGVASFMACDKERCLPPDEYEFAVTIK
ncbi:sugar transporter [Sphingobacterium sp. DK4209]|uniref:Sugar transporter n=1 Tax=Sphingobacterium zhuxiongii TaxID=2662364 RepID=A0A5Q0Q4V3_9SPHI|nr:MULTISPECIES: protein-disulfide reductase DsbD domain-containing protein [unclassified Sphingobacterium]MVZ67321.1 sugar transporter [Sphingobacterium sp. DK4209]QGA25057.1 sugar transporter [Sphingobacterium sp. dk4302]